ncbi:MAG: hypothetical protein KA795_06455 [Burkholderiaceae bacterium]|nr:hypothetical protein [Burkholderiaceae bacterium]
MKQPTRVPSEAAARFVHAAVSMSPSPGVRKQMQQEQVAATELGLPWEVVLTTPHGYSRGGVVARLARYASLRLTFCRLLLQRHARGEVVVLRHSVGDVFVFFFSYFWGPYLTVHHTLEEPELEQHRGWSMAILRRLERTVGRSVVRRSMAIIGVTQEIIDHQRLRIGMAEKPAFVYPNGILYPADGPGLLQDERSEDVPELLFVAGYFYDWHGLDRLLDRLPDADCQFVLHLVGQLPEALARRAREDRRIRLHGMLDAEAMQPLVRRSWIGLSSFALDVKGMTQACTLKVRDYLRDGLPVYAGHLDSGLGADFPYFRVGNADFMPILDFARSVRSLSRYEVAVAARPLIDKRSLLNRLYAEANELLAKDHPVERP